MFKKLLVLFFIALPMFGFTASNDPESRVVLTADNTLVMDSEFSSASVAKVALEARELDAALGRGKPIYLVMLSPGGSIDAGLELIDNLNAINRPIHTVTLFGASMAFQTAQALNGTRYVSPTGTLMSHKARGGFQGEFPGQLDSRYQYFLRRLHKLELRTVARSKGRLTLESYRALYENEYWCEGQDCVDSGVADTVAHVACDSSLSGSKSIKETSAFMGMKVEVQGTKAACPTITAVLNLKAKVNGRSVDYESLDSISRDLGLPLAQAFHLKEYLNAKIEVLKQGHQNRKQF